MKAQRTKYLLGLFLLCCTATVHATTPLWLLFVNSRCDGEEFESSSVLPAAEMAIERINSNSSLLPGYSLNLTVTRQPTATDVEVFVEGLLQPPDELAVLYPGCSSESRVVVDVADSNLFNVTVVTYAFSNLAADSLDFPHHFRMVPSEINQINGIVAFILQFGWQRITVIVEELPVYVSIADRLFVPLSDERGIRIDVSLLRSFEDTADLRDISTTESRIFVLITSQIFARAALCEAWRGNLRYPGYVWITQGWYSDQWWVEGYENCTGEDLESFLEGAIAISHFPTASNESKATDIGITSLEFAEEFGSRTHTPQSLVPDYAHYVFDAVWATALALNNTTEVNDTAAVRRALRDLNFTGVSGPVTFGAQDGMRSLDRLTVLQYRQVDGTLTKEKVAVILRTGEGNLNFSFLGSEGNTSLWPGGVPSDGSPIIVENFTLLPLTIICYIYATAGIVFAIICLIFNVIFRNKKLIRLTSPNLNYIIVAGTLCFYASVYFILSPEVPKNTTIVFCNISLWLDAIAFSLCFGTINAKMWRVYIICHKPKPSMKKTPIQDWHLAVIVLIFVMVDLIILTTVTAIDGVRYTVRTINDAENPTFVNEEGFTVISTVTTCYSTAQLYILGVIYKIAIQLIGVILAFSIRKVKIKGLNDSREISIILYITSIILLIEEGFTVISTVTTCYSTAQFYILGFIYSYKIVIQLIGVVLAFSIRKVKIKGLNDSKEISIILYITSIILVIVIVITLALRNYINVNGGTFSVGVSTGSTVVLGFIFIPKMIGLYRDPHGEKIFEISKSVSTSNAVETSNIAANLQKKVTELEKKLTELQFEVQESDLAKGNSN